MHTTLVLTHVLFFSWPLSFLPSVCLVVGMLECVLCGLEFGTGVGVLWGGDFYLILTEGEVLNVVHLYSIDSVSFVGYTVRVLEFPYCLRGASGYLAGVGFRLSPLDFVF